MSMDKNVKAMASASRPRGFSGAASGSGRPAANTPMSERQQMALLMQMTSSNQSELSPGGNGPARSRDRNERGETALHVAAIKGDHDGVKKLLEQGMSPNVADFAGWTPLHEACNHGHYNVALILVKAGANVNAKGLDDDTPLHDAAIVGQLKLVKMLVERGADPTFKNRKGKTACDVAAPSVYNFLITAKESSNGRMGQPVKKLGDSKKSTDDADDSATTTSSSSGTTGTGNNTNTTPTGNVATTNQSGTFNSGPINTSLSSTPVPTSKDEDDVYEFKSTPKDSSNSSSSGDDKSDGGKNSDKSSDEKSDDQGANQPKRSYSDLESNDEMGGVGDDESKRKKRKDSDAIGKDPIATSTSTGSKGSTGHRIPLRHDKTSKVQNVTPKALTLTSKAAASLDRKSPCASPKPVPTTAATASKTTDSDAEPDDTKSGDTFGVGGGPKVPPLKIVIPQQSTSGDTDTGSRNGKNASTRSHPALPYVVASSSNSNDSADKESASSRCTSPSDSTKGTDDKKVAPSDEQTRQPRILRSSHRAGSSAGANGTNNNGGATVTNQTVDRGSNNSSPQLQSSSPSPAAPADKIESTEITTTTNSTTGGTATNKQNSTVSTTASTTSPAVTVAVVEAESSTGGNVPSPSASSTSSTKETIQHTIELHPRKRKIRASKEDSKQPSNSNTSTQSTNSGGNGTGSNASNCNNDNAAANEIHPHDQPITNCYQMYLNIRKQIERRHRTLFPVQPKPPQGFKDYLMNRCTYVLAGKAPNEPVFTYPTSLAASMKDIFAVQEKERHKLKMQHIVEKEKLVLAVEQEILRVHSRAARALANQSLPFSACSILKDDEVYNMITPEQEEKDRNARSRYNGRLFLGWLQDVDDKWEKIKEAMVLRHHNEAESLHAVQKMDWEWKMKELCLCEFKAQPVIDESYVPMVHVSDDFDLLPA